MPFFGDRDDCDGVFFQAFAACSSRAASRFCERFHVFDGGLPAAVESTCLLPKYDRAVGYRTNRWSRVANGQINYMKVTGVKKGIWLLGRHRCSFRKSAMPSFGLGEWCNEACFLTGRARGGDMD